MVEAVFCAEELLCAEVTVAEVPDAAVRDVTVVPADAAAELPAVVVVVCEEEVTVVAPDVCCDDTEVVSGTVVSFMDAEFSAEVFVAEVKVVSDCEVV